MTLRRMHAALVLPLVALATLTWCPGCESPKTRSNGGSGKASRDKDGDDDQDQDTRQDQDADRTAVAKSGSNNSDDRPNGQEKEKEKERDASSATAPEDGEGSKSAGKSTAAAGTDRGPKQVASRPGADASDDEVKPGDWNQWGGTGKRNNVPFGTNIPIEWAVGEFDPMTGDWIKATSLNVLFAQRLGSQTYGNPVVAGGKAFVGTNNSAGYLKRYPADVDLGCLICLDAKTGDFLWQHSSEKLPAGRVVDWPLMGICCAPLVEGDRLWFVTSRGEVRCLDTNGFHDGEDDGPVKGEPARLFDLPAATNADAIKGLNEGTVADGVRAAFARAGMPLTGDAQVEKGDGDNKWQIKAKVGETSRDFRALVAGPNLSVFKTITVDDKEEADVVWVLDMMTTLKTAQHNMCSCSVTSLGDYLFVNTSNGVDDSHLTIPQPNAPSFICMNKNTGEVYWTDKSPGENIIHGQWSSPTVAELGGVPQVIFGGGDAWIYSFRADKGDNGKPTLLWKFDANPKISKFVLGGRGTRNDIIATPVVYKGLVYVPVGQDPEHGEGTGHLWCIDPTKKLDGSDVSAELAMKVEGDKRSPIPHRRLQAVIEEEGEVAVPNPDSAVVWHYSEYDQNGDGKIEFEETMHRSISTVTIKNDLLFAVDFSGLIHCLDAQTGKVYWTHDMLAAAWGSPLIVDNHVYIGNEDGNIVIFNLDKQKHEPIAKIEMANAIYSSPIVANNTLYIANKTHLFAIAHPDEETEK